MTASAPASVGEAPLVTPASKREPCLTDSAILFLVILAMMAIGVLMVFSASRKAYAAGDTWFFTKHMLFVPLAIGAVLLGAIVPYRKLNRRWVALSALGATVLLLAAVLVAGEGHGTVRRWFAFSLGPLRLSIQPSEFAKITLVIFLAWFFSQPLGDPTHTASKWPLVAWLKRVLQSKPKTLLRAFLPALLVIGLVGGLIAKADFGTGALVGLVAVLLCLIAAWRWWYTLLLIVPGIAGLYKFVWLVDYRRERLEVWLDPWKDIDGAGWHVCQSLMGIGSGGVQGVGFGAGIQKLYIPENTTDFIFAVICEEMGMLGGLLVIGLFGIFLWRASRVVRRAPDNFGFLLASGIMLTVGLQAILNIGVVTGALPAKGICLPFISYGGTGLVLMGLAVGLLISISRAGDAAEREKYSKPLVYAPAQVSSPEHKLGGMIEQQQVSAAPQTETSEEEPTGHA